MPSSYLYRIVKNSIILVYLIRTIFSNKADIFSFIMGDLYCPLYWETFYRSAYPLRWVIEKYLTYWLITKYGFQLIGNLKCYLIGKHYWRYAVFISIYRSIPWYSLLEMPDLCLSRKKKTLFEGISLCQPKQLVQRYRVNVYYSELNDAYYRAHMA